MSTTALSGLRDYLCGSLSLANMLWLSQQLAEYVKQKQMQEDESLLPRKPYTMDEINSILDEAERQAKSGEYVDNEDVFRNWDKRRAIRRKVQKEEEQLEMAV